MKTGNVYWVTGLSGSGKTTIGSELLNALNNKCIFLDGDDLRTIYGDDIGYSLEDRKKMAMRNSKLCRMLSNQGFDVICCTIAMFHDIRAWNRENINNYKEIYLKVKPEVLIARDQKNLYSKYKKGTTDNVVGLDLKFEEPLNPDIIINNNGDKSPKEIIEYILSNREV